MRLRLPGRSIRGRMLLAAILIEATMLTLLVANSLRLLSGKMTEQAAQHAAQMTPVLQAALIAPLAQRDSATVKAILDECAATQGIDYLAVRDSRGKPVAMSGWDPAQPLPAADRSFHLYGTQGTPRYNVVAPIQEAGQNLGTVHFGVNLAQILAAHRELLTQGILIALGELLLSAGLLTVVGFWLTRHLTALTLASEAVARGELFPPPVWEGTDDVGRLGATFNAMSRAIRDRIQDLIENRDIQTILIQENAEALSRLDEITHTMADGLYVLDEAGCITFVNPRAGEILGWSTEELLGRRAHDLFHWHPQANEAIPESACESLEVIRTGLPFRSEAEAYLRKDGSFIRVSKAINPIRRDQGIVGAVISFQDVTEKLRIAEALRISEERLALAVEGSGDGLWDWDILADTVIFSDTWKRMIGYLPGELSNQLEEWSSRLHPEDRERTLAELQEHLEGRSPLYLSEHRFLHRDGHFLWVLDRGQLVGWDAVGVPTRMIGTHADISARKNLEQSLARKDQILEAISSGVITLLDSLVWQERIPAFLESIGRASSASRVQILQVIGNPDTDEEVWADMVFEWCREGVPPKLQSPLFHRIPTRAAGFAHWNDRLKAGQLVHGPSNSFPELVPFQLGHPLSTNILVVPVHVRGQWWGAIGFMDDSNGLPWPSAHREILRLTGKALGSKIERTDTRLELERRVAERTRELDQMNLDLIEEMEARAKSEASNRMVLVELEQARKMESIGHLAAGIAHEINTPTQFLGNNLGFLKEGYSKLSRFQKACQDHLAGLPQPQTEQLEALRRELNLDFLQEEMPLTISESMEGIDRITKIVRAMKEFSHPGGRDWSSVDLNQCLMTTSTVARNEWKYIAELELDLDPTLPLIHGLPVELNQAFLNFIVNAADAIRERPPSETLDGKMVLSTRRQDQGVEIRISDNGVGIPKPVLKKMYDPFFTTKDVGKGTGQGLTVCYQVIVNLHGGSLRCESVPGDGTTFIIQLPLTKASAAPAGKGA